MDPAHDTNLVATMFTTKQDNDPYKLFKSFLHIHMVYNTAARVLKAGTSEDSLVVTEYTFKFESTAPVDLVALQKAAYEWGKVAGVDVSIQRDDVFRRYKRLVVFDMDSTLIKQEVIDEIALHLDSINPTKNVGSKVAEITELAMQGQIDFKESLRRRVALLAGTPTTVYEAIRQKLVFQDGARVLCARLKRLGYKLAVVSGGFVPLAKYVQAELGLDYAFANNMEASVDGTTLTGKVLGEIVDGQRKKELLETIARQEGISLEQTIAVGDGANDLLMLSRSSFGVAFNGKPKLQENATARINHASLALLPYFFGLTEEEQLQLDTPEKP